MYGRIFLTHFSHSDYARTVRDQEKLPAAKLLGLTSVAAQLKQVSIHLSAVTDNSNAKNVNYNMRLNLGMSTVNSYSKSFFSIKICIGSARSMLSNRIYRMNFNEMV